MKTIRGRKAVVTGAAMGIGRAIGLALAAEGADLFLIDIDAKTMDTVAAEARRYGVEVIACACDLAEPGQVDATIARIRAWGGVNILVNNAGIAHYGPTHRMSDAQWDRIMAVNLLAPIQLVRALLPLLLAADEAHILNMCSVFGLATWRKTLAYQTTKHGLVGFTAGLRAEYGCDHFGVTAVCPGFVRSALVEELAAGGRHGRRAIPSWICTTPEAVAARALRAISRNRGLAVITPAAHIWWRFGRYFPRLTGWLIREGWRRRGRTDP